MADTADTTPSAPQTQSTSAPSTAAVAPAPVSPEQKATAAANINTAGQNVVAELQAAHNHHAAAGNEGLCAIIKEEIDKALAYFQALEQKIREEF